MILRGKLFVESPLYRGNARKTLFTRDGDGTQSGSDLEFTRAISDVVGVPVVASGGAGQLGHFYEAVIVGGARILLAASVFHYRILSIKEVKEYLRGQGVQVSL